MISSPMVVSQATTSASLQPLRVSTSSQSQLLLVPQRVSAYHSSGAPAISKEKMRSAESGASEHWLELKTKSLAAPAKVSKGKMVDVGTCVTAGRWCSWPSCWRRAEHRRAGVGRPGRRIRRLRRRVGGRRGRVGGQRGVGHRRRVGPRPRVGRRRHEGVGLGRVGIVAERLRRASDGGEGEEQEGPDRERSLHGARILHHRVMPICPRMKAASKADSRSLS
jgi:hypothetical protein